jgi:AraC family transcriptional regulator
MRRQASPTVVHSLAEVIAVHLAEYGETGQASHSKSPSLPGYKLRQITQWMSEHLNEEFNLERLRG